MKTIEFDRFIDITIDKVGCLRFQPVASNGHL